MLNGEYVTIHHWYHTMSKTLMDYGVYVHPFWAFRKAATSPQGFDVAGTPTETGGKDLPYIMKDTIKAMSRKGVHILHNP